jgi:hypothetical protein
MAPVVSLEMLAYDCRLFNEALGDGYEGARTLQGWLVRSDDWRDPQAFVLSPESAVRIGSAIVKSPSHYDAGLAAAHEALNLMQGAWEDGCLQLDSREMCWMETMRQSLADLPDTENRFIDRMLDEADKGKFLPAEYELALEALI